MLGDSATVPALVAIGEEVEDKELFIYTFWRGGVVVCCCVLLCVVVLLCSEGCTHLKWFEPLPQLYSLSVGCVRAWLLLVRAQRNVLLLVLGIGQTKISKR